MKRRRGVHPRVWGIGEEAIINTRFGQDRRLLRFYVKRARFGWHVWLVGANDQHLAPVSTGNYRGADFIVVRHLIKKFVDGVRGKRN